MFDIFVSPHTLAIEGIVITNACACLRVSYEYMVNPTHVSLTNRYWSFITAVLGKSRCLT